MKNSRFSRVFISRDLTRAQRQELLRRRGASGRGAGRPAVGGADRRVAGVPSVELAHTSSPSVAQLSRTFERDDAVSASPSAPPITPRAPPKSGLVASGAPPPLGGPPPNVSGPTLGRPAAGPDLRRSGLGNFLVRRES